MSPASDGVWRLSSEQRLWSVFAKKRGLQPEGRSSGSTIWCCRDFTAERSDQLRLTDITEHPVDLSHPALQHPFSIFRVKVCTVRQSGQPGPFEPSAALASSSDTRFLLWARMPSTRVHPNVRARATSGRKVEVLFAVLIEAVPMIAAWTKDSVRNIKPQTAVMIRNILRKFVIPPHIDECLTL